MRVSFVVQPWRGEGAVDLGEQTALMRRSLVLDGMECDCTGWFLEADEGQPFLKLHVRGVDEADRSALAASEHLATIDSDGDVVPEGSPDDGYFVFVVTAFRMETPDGQTAIGL